ncbi:MAG: sigma 54-interacting transcriptional regulator [Deltaproteobacteria bacterium]|nr:sigma 54-interacting transcriptional regulator [Deltaproteobacteria bacterium]
MQRHKTRDAQRRRVDDHQKTACEKKSLVLQVEGTRKEFPLSGASSWSIGNAKDNDIVINDDPYVSRYHCELSLTDKDGLVLHDRGSRNGTWIDNTQVERAKLRHGSRLRVGRTQLRLSGSPSLARAALIGLHPAMIRVHQEIEKLGPTTHPVLISGETGTGKEIVAQALHEASGRRDGPFEAINCAAIPHDLAESELFGHVRGAFTGADQNYTGAFGRADGGTLFLDEIGEMPLELQPKLLRALEQRRVRPVGGDRSINVDIRVVAATHRNLDRDAAEQRFRSDLYHRLAVCVISLPPLRARRSDIALLAEHFLSQVEGGNGVALAPDAISWLTTQDWEGNVRALRHAVARAVVNGNAVLRAADFTMTPVAAIRSAREEGTIKVSGRSFSEIRHDVFRYALEQTGGNRSAAASLLQIPKSTFFDQLRVAEAKHGKFGP